MKTTNTPKTTGVVASLTIGMTFLAGTAMAKPGDLLKSLKADGEVTYEEYLAQAKERFNKLDVNADGVITKDELKEARADRREDGKERRQERRSKRGKKDPANLFVDRNDDGVITKEDLPKRAARMFKKVDSDGDGEISAEEKEAFLERVKERRSERGERPKKRRGEKRRNR